MENLEFSSINDITLKLLNQEASSDQLDEYYNMCKNMLQHARLETDNAVESISRWNKTRLTHLDNEF
ncbi:hypothetical protein PULV_a1459 [Pseudoalteromonas ulvae UL12]|uniref:Uncharacterized protein n=1 Tax=Pseudoalteromonas ulvae TaxID=107327 RepID=A0A244CNE8_PSEDV|nr:hypothetical protein [Pseudoalteromonas ulvae]MBE0363935.1 hypothetical protein [Pseudoalteromonas ulvae UL12]OUL56729.1 hypothetical protein B1199_15245 [Pseudoalteromonas ulvae]